MTPHALTPERYREIRTHDRLHRWLVVMDGRGAYGPTVADAVALHSRLAPDRYATPTREGTRELLVAQWRAAFGSSTSGRAVVDAVANIADEMNAQLEALADSLLTAPASRDDSVDALLYLHRSASEARQDGDTVGHE